MANMMEMRMAGDDLAPDQEALYAFLTEEATTPGVATPLQFIQALPVVSAKEVAQRFRTLELKPGSVIYKQGEEASELYMVLKG